MIKFWQRYNFFGYTVTWLRGERGPYNRITVCITILSVLNVSEGGIQLRFEVAVVVLAEDDIVGGVADALPHLATNLRLERGGVNVVSF